MNQPRAAVWSTASAMASRPRSNKRRGWPDGLYERRGYFTWRNPLTGKEMGIGRVPLGEAKAQAAEANVAVQGLQDKPRLVDRLTGKSDTSLRAWLERYEIKLGLVKGDAPADRALAYNTTKTYRSAVKLIRETYADSLDLPLDRVTTFIVAAGINKVKARAARSAQAMRSRLTDIFDSAIAEGWTTSNPVRVTSDVSVTVKRARMTWDVFKRLYDSLPAGPVKNATALALVSGQPREVIAGAMFTDVGMVERPGAAPVECWKFTRGKTGAMIAIPLDLHLEAFVLSLRDVVKQCRATNVASKFMVHNSTRRKGAKLGGPVALNRLTKDFTAAVLALKIDWGDAEAPTFHELRSLSKRLYEAQGGVNTRDLLGHKTERMGELYADARGAEYKLVSLG